MDDSELFDVFNVDNNPEPAQKTIQAPPLEKPKKQKKSKHENTVSNDKVIANGGGGGVVKGKRRHDHVSTETSKEKQMDGVESTGIAKRMRKLAENPIIVDSFETETDQIVPATTGLQGVAPTDKNIIIKKRYRHAAVFPTADWKFTPLESHQFADPPARVYPFELDPFQKMSIAAIERNESVLVSAHTSAGKTVVAEYAIALSLKEKQRVIYTSPIKALSNQKYRELAAEFKDVGLMTGDVTINPTASCIVMTTEILRSMLYRGSEVMREVAWVIFDEIHYMRDKERGVVWEETIILLPDKVHYVFLSATIPNALQFAQWITKIHTQPCHVVYTDFRPTPLQHYLFPTGGNGIFLVVDDGGKFREENFQKAMAILEDRKGDSSNAVFGAKGKKGKTWKGGASQGDDTPTDIYKIIKMIMLKNYNPVIVFSFSKKECEHLALKMSKLDFNDKDEKDLVRNIYTNALNSLSENDRNLPQVQEILPLLQRGIGIHHAGLLNILKEVIEILFGEGLVKVLFATETFAMGLNMPAKTVVFTNHMKFDGKEMRAITSGEYIQMSGRAGRRGLDDRGVVMLMVDGKMEPDLAKRMLMGEADRLNSAFHLSYNMVLNLMRLEGIPPEFMLERCFFQFQNNAEIPQMEKELMEMEGERDAMEVERESVIAEYHDLKEKITVYEQDMKDVMNHPNYCVPFMQPGRLIRIRNGKTLFDWGVIINHNRRLKPINQEADFTPQESFIVDVAMWLDASSAVFKNGPRIKHGDFAALAPGPAGINAKEGRMEVVPVTMATIDALSQLRVGLPKEIKSIDQRLDLRKAVQEVKRRFPDGLPLLDPIKHMHIKDESFRNLVKKIEVMESRLMDNALYDSPDLERIYNQYQLKVDVLTKIKSHKKKILAANSVMQLDELKNRKRVLRRLGFTSSADVIEMKGRVACEISSADELLLTEMMFQGAFNDLTPEQCAALLSCFVLSERIEMRQPLKDEALTNPLKIMTSIARRIAKVSQESKMSVIEEEYIASFKPELMDVVYSWAKGSNFQEICKKTDIYEGSLIRAFRLLVEVLRQMVQAAKAIGNTELENKFAAAITAIKRDIVFAPSLYL